MPAVRGGDKPSDILTFPDRENYSNGSAIMDLIFEKLFPVFAVIALGWLLRRWGVVEESFFRQSDRLVYFIFLPLLLVWKIGRPLNPDHLDWAMIGSCLAVLIVALSASLILARRINLPARQLGSFVQIAIRFNTYVALGLIMSFHGEDGVVRFGVLISLAIPLINLFCVSIMTWVGDPDGRLITRLGLAAKSTLTNPLILGCLAGLTLAWTGWVIPRPVDAAMKLASGLGLPLALLSVGAILDFTTLRGRFKPALLAGSIKLLLCPALGLIFMHLLGVRGPSLAVGLIFLGMPTSSQSHILSAQLGSDPELAAGGIALTTLLSFFTLSLIGLLLG